LTRKEIKEMVIERIRRGLPLHGWMRDIAVEIALEAEEEKQE
jgi:hypothetical protein